MNIIFEDCVVGEVNTKTLPTNSYIVCYEVAEKVKCDIVQCGSSVEVFNFYYDTYGNVKDIKWTNGAINPRTYGYKPKEVKQKKR